MARTALVKEGSLDHDVLGQLNAMLVELYAASGADATTIAAHTVTIAAQGVTIAAHTATLAAAAAAIALVQAIPTADAHDGLTIWNDAGVLKLSSPS
jgi:hypothetical protein